MALRFTHSASRHGVNPERAAFVIEHCDSPIYPPSESDDAGFVVFLGLDANGVPIEVVAFESDRETLLVIHVMRMRRRYLQEFRRLMCQRRT